MGTQKERESNARHFGMRCIQSIAESDTAFALCDKNALYTGCVGHLAPHALPPYSLRSLPALAPLSPWHSPSQAPALSPRTVRHAVLPLPLLARFVSPRKKNALPSILGRAFRGASSIVAFRAVLALKTLNALRSQVLGRLQNQGFQESKPERKIKKTAVQ